MGEKGRERDGEAVVAGRSASRLRDDKSEEEGGQEDERRGGERERENREDWDGCLPAESSRAAPLLRPLL